ncbi:MAG: hypothetical protein ACERKX_13410 [Anaerolineales bacterium]
MNLKKHFWIVAVIGLISFLPLLARAQTDTEVEQLEVLLWPEYDRPELLAIQKIRFTPDTDLPATIQLSIPASARTPHAVAAWLPDGTLGEELEWTQETRGDWIVIETETPTTGVWIEYYDALDVDGQDRSYVFQWPGEIAVDDLRFDILYPPGSRDVQISPAGEEIRNENGARHSVGELGALEIGEQAEISVSYNNPSAPLLPPFAMDGEAQVFDNLEITMWPEYDRPETLVIYQVSLPSDLTLPAEVRIPVPSAYGNPSAAAFRDAGGNLVLAEHQQEDHGDWSVLRVETESPFVWVEYYADLWLEGDQRAYTFPWPGGIELDTVSYTVQLPAAGSKMQVSPGGTFGPGEDGLVYYSGSLGSVPASAPAQISFSYANTSGLLTKDAEIPPQIIERPQDTSGGTPGLESLLPYVLGAFGLLLVVGGAWLFYRGRKDKSTRSRPERKRRKKRGGDKSSKKELDAGLVFCHVCGTKSTTSDRFCRQCGAQLRT